MYFRRAVTALAFTGLVAGVQPVAAESAADKDAAREHFAQGARAYSEGRYKDAIDLFFDADRLAPNPAFAYNIGLAYEQLGDAANALRWYRSYLRDLPDAPDQGEVTPRIAEAEKHLAARSVQQVTVVSSPEGATVSLDGRRVGVAPYTTELAPGPHEMGLELHGFTDSAASFDLPADHAIDVAVVLERTPDPMTVSVVSPPPRDRGPVVAPSWHARIHPVTWATLGFGLAGLGAGLGFELARESEVDDARHSTTNLVGKDEYDRARTYEAAAKVSVAAGAAVTVLGGALLYWDLSSPGIPSTRVGAAVACVGPRCDVRLNGSF